MKFYLPAAALVLVLMEKVWSSHGVMVMLSPENLDKNFPRVCSEKTTQTVSLSSSPPAPSTQDTVASEPYSQLQGQTRVRVEGLKETWQEEGEVLPEVGP